MHVYMCMYVCMSYVCKYCHVGEVPVCMYACMHVCMYVICM
jgi:hypothetical protein